MDDGLKQRLVGAAVLTAVAVLFVPVLFERESRLVVDHTTQIPPAMVVEPVVVEAPQDNLQIPPVKPADAMYELLPEEPETLPEAAPEAASTSHEAVAQASVPAPSAKALDQPAKSAPPAVLDERGLPNAWAVQVASFNTLARANAMRDRLLAQDYPAFTRSANTTQGTLTRVFVGPKISRDQAYRLKSKLDAELKTETLVVTFMP